MNKDQELANSKALDDLTQKSKTFCVYPWIHQVVLPPGTVGFCCVAMEGGPVLDERGQRHKIPAKTLSEAWNSDFQKEIRRKLYAGEAVSGCQLCQYQESIGKESYRKMHNKEWGEKAGPEIAKRIEKSARNGFSVEDGALHLDLRLGNLCNLKCRMCNPYNSTKIASETEQLLQTDPDFRAIYHKNFGTENAKISKWYEEPSFWDGIYAQLPTLRKVYLTGGEPTLIKKNYEFLRRCVETGHSKHIFLMFNINCTNLTDEFVSYLKHFEFVLVNASIDGYGETNEYIRGSSDWNLIDRNFRKLLTVDGPVQVGVTPTVQVYNILNLVDLLSYVQNVSTEVGKAINVDFLYVTDPAYLDIRILPDSIRQQALLKIVKFSQAHEQFISGSYGLGDSIRSLITALKKPASPNPERLDEFARYTRSLDRSRGENFRMAMPDLDQSLRAEGIQV